MPGRHRLVVSNQLQERILEQETAQLSGIKQLPTSGGHPQTDGLVEQFNQTFKQMLKRLVSKQVVCGPVKLNIFFCIVYI